MSALRETGRLRADLQRIGSYARHSIRRAAGFALRLHAEEVTPEHLLGSLFEDEDCAATLAVLHAFADPETLSIELLALSPGILVVGSKRSLPFSPRGVHALERARGVAADAGASTITPEHLACAASEELDARQREALGSIGFLSAPNVSHPGESSPAASAFDPEGGSQPLSEDGPVLKHLSAQTRRAVSAACRTAHRLGRNAISPAHLVMSALEFTETTRFGATARRVSLALHGQDEDVSPLPLRTLPGDKPLGELLARLPDGAGTHAILAHQVEHGSQEIQALLQRQRITRELIAHTTGAFRDPEMPAAEGIETGTHGVPGPG